MLKSVFFFAIGLVLLTKKLGRWQGIALLGIYAAFCVCQFVL